MSMPKFAWHRFHFCRFIAGHFNRAKQASSVAKDTATVLGSTGNLFDLQLLASLEISLAAKPVLHGFLELIEGNTGADFHLTISDGKRVVKDAGVGETAHGKRIEPLQRAGKQLAVIVIRHANLAGEHELIL